MGVHPRPLQESESRQPSVNRSQEVAIRILEEAAEAEAVELNLSDVVGTKRMAQRIGQEVARTR